MTRGKPTSHPGVYRMTNDTWLIRAKAKTGLKTKERERQVIGTLHEAARAHLELKEELFAELRAAEGAANDVDTTAPREPAAPIRTKADEPARVAMAPSEPARAPTKASEPSRDIRLMIVMEVALGVRFAEVSALEWGDIDLDRGFLLIQRSQNEGEVGETKTAGTRRPKALLPEVIELLREHRAWQIENEVPGLERHLVFPSRKGGYRTPSILTKPLARCIERAGLSKRLTSHALRRTTNTLVVETAGDATARKMLGHAPTAFQMTERYLVVDRERELSVMRKALGDALGGAKEAEESRNENDSRSPTLPPHQNGRFTTPQ